MNLRNASIGALICLLSFSLVGAGNIFAKKPSAFDDFTESFNKRILDHKRFGDLEFRHVIEPEGKGGNRVLRMTLRRPFRGPGSELRFPGSISRDIKSFSVHMTVLKRKATFGITPITRMRGTFYNTGSGTPLGDVGVEVQITETEAQFFVFRCTSFDFRCNNFFPISGSFQFIGPLTTRVTYTMTLSWDGANRFDFTVAEQATGFPVGSASFVTSDALQLPVITDSKVIENTVQLAAFDPLINPPASSDITIDNVQIDTGGGLVPYDDFESDLIDPLKWTLQEHIRVVSDRAALLSVRSSGNNSTNRSTFLRTVPGTVYSTPKIAADLTVTDTFLDDQSPDKRGQLRATVVLRFRPSFSNILNTFFFRSGVRDRGSGLERFMSAFRCDDLFCNAFTDIPVTVTGGEVYSLGSTVAVSVEYDAANNRMLFTSGGFSGVSDLTAFPDFDPTVFLVGLARVRARNFGFLGEGAITARYDNLTMGSP